MYRKNYDDVPSLRKYVLVKKNKKISELEKAGFEWAVVCDKNKLSYEIDWLGIPVIQTPEDLILLQELIFKVKPDYIIELGIAHGGGMIFEASLLELLGKGNVIGIDVEIRAHNRTAIEAHPLSHRIQMIEKSSIAAETIEEVQTMVPAGSKVIVCMDSDHTKPHVLRELELYRQFVPVGCYVVVFDMISSALAKLKAAKKLYLDNGPSEAVEEFLRVDKNFEIDKEFNKLYSAHNRNGYLRRIR